MCDIILAIQKKAQYSEVLFWREDMLYSTVGQFFSMKLFISLISKFDVCASESKKIDLCGDVNIITIQCPFCGKGWVFIMKLLGKEVIFFILASLSILVTRSSVDHGFR